MLGAPLWAARLLLTARGPVTVMCVDLMEHCRFLMYLLTCVFCYFFSFLPFPSPNFFSDPEFLCQLTARYFCFLLLLETKQNHK